MRVFFFMWVDNKKSIALSKVLLCAAFVACFQAITMKQCGLVSGHSFDKRCLSKSSSPAVNYSQGLVSSDGNVFLKNVEWITSSERRWTLHFFTCSIWQRGKTRSHNALCIFHCHLVMMFQLATNWIHSQTNRSPPSMGKADRQRPSLQQACVYAVTIHIYMMFVYISTVSKNIYIVTDLL